MMPSMKRKNRKIQVRTVKPTVQTGFRFDADLVARLRQLADAQNRTLSNLVETLLKQSIGMAEPPEPLRAKTLDQAA